MRKSILFVLFLFAVACKKDKFKEDSAFEEGSGVELFIIDSTRVHSFVGDTIAIIFFRVNPLVENNLIGVQFFKLRRDGLSLVSFLKAKNGFLSDSNIPAQHGRTSNYQLSMVDFENRESKLSKLIPITIP